MPGGQDEPVAVRPVGVGRRVAEVPRPQRVGHRGRAHWGAGMAGVRLLDAVDREGPDGVDRESIELVRGEGHRSLRWRLSRPARPTGHRRRTRRGGYCRTLIVARARGRSRGYARPRACHPRVTPSAHAGPDAPRRGPAARGRGRRHGGRRGARPGRRHRARHRRARPGVRAAGWVGGDRGALARAARRAIGARVRRRTRRPRPSADPGRDRGRRHRPRGARTGRADRPDRGAGGARWPALVRPGPRRRAPPATRGPQGRRGSRARRRCTCRPTRCSTSPSGAPAWRPSAWVARRAPW